MNIFHKKLIAGILALVMCFCSVGFVSAEDNIIAINAEGTTEISFDNAIEKATDTGEGHYKFYGDSFATVKIDVAETGYYTMGVNILTRDQIENGWEVYVDDVLDGTFYTWLAAPVWYNGEALDLYLTEGEHTIKVMCTKGNAYNDGFTLTRKENDYKAQWIKGSTATGTGTVTWERYVLSNAGNVNQYADYVVNVEEAGKYEISLQHSYNNSVINSAVLTVNGGQEKTVSLPQLERGTRGDEHKLTVLGEVNLVAGENTIRIINKDYPNGATFIVDMLKVDKLSDEGNSDTSVSIGETVRIPMDSYSSSSQEFEIIDGLVDFFGGDWAKFDFDVKATGKYTLGMKFGGDTTMSQKFKVSVNGENQIDTTVAVDNDYVEPADVEIGELTFVTKGNNEIKIENTSLNTDIWVEDIYLTLVEYVDEYIPTEEPTEEPTPEPTEAPEVDAMGENIRIHMRDYVSAYNANNGGNFLRQDGSNPDNTLWQINDWAEYALNISTPGTYEIGLCLGGNAAQVQKLTAYVDGVEQLVANITIADEMGASIPKKDVVFGNITFATPGNHTLKLKKNDGGFIYSSHVFLNLTDSSEIRVSMGSYTEANSSKVSGALDYEGGNYCLRSGDWAKYNVFIGTPGKYKLGLKETGNTGQTSKLKVSVNGVEQFNNNSKTPLSGMWAQFADVEYGEVTFNYSGVNELYIEHTGSSDGEYVANIYLVLVEELDAGANIPDVPETTEIRLHMANDSFEKYCNLTGANDLKIEGGCVTWHGKGDSSPIGDWAKFKVNIEDPGTYRFGLELSGTVGGTTALRVEVDGEEKIESTQRTMTSYYGTLTDTDFGMLEFPEAGEYELYVEHTGLAGQYVGHIILTHLGDALEISGVKAGEVDLMEENVIPVGTDIFMVNFSKLIRNSDVTGENGQIALKDSNGKNIEISASVVKATAVIAIKEALKLDETYTLSVGAISDSVENSVSIPAKFTFTTEEGDATAFIRDAVALFKENVAEITATMFSSQNIGIKGRAFEIYLEYPNGDVSDKAIATGISGENGAIEFTYTLPSDGVDGKYTFIVGGEYVGTEAKATAVYVSPSLRENIEDALNDASTANDVKDVLEDNKDYLSFDPKKAVAGLDEEKVYAHFTEKDTDFEDIANDFAKYVAIEKLNQATSSNIGDILDDAENWEAMGLDENMYNVLTTEKSLVKDAILALDDDLTADEFINALNDIVQNSLRKETSKTSLTPDVSDETVYTGQGIYLPIDFVEEFEGLKKISYEISASDSDMLENSKLKLNVPADVEIDITDEILKAEIIFDETVSNGKLGNIIITAPEKTGDYSVTVKGEIEYLCEVGDISLIIEAAVNEKDVEITVVKTPSNSSGGNSSSSANPNYRPSTGGGNGGSGNSGSAPVVTPPAPEKYAFSDITSNHWAYPAVDYLVESGVIEKTADKRFNPETAISREEIVKMIVLALGLTDVNAETTLTDVSKDNPYYVYIASAEKNGIIKGNDAGEFMLGSQLTREDICVIIHRAVSSKLSFEANGEAFADDASISDYAKTAVYEMRGSGLINGMGNNEFAPKGTVTKAQTAKMIYEIVKAVAK